MAVSKIIIFEKGYILALFYSSIIFYYCFYKMGENMKRKNNLYKNLYKMENIIEAYNEVCKNTKNKRKVRNYQEYKCIYISRIYEVLKNKEYKVGPYNVFTIYEPKERRIVSQGLHDKVINHLVSRHILMPAIIPCLIDTNVASRKKMGTKKGREIFENYNRICKNKYGTYYVLKCDISKYFFSINQQILKEKLKKKIKDKDALDIVYKIIDSESKGLGIRKYDEPSFSHFLLE